jgi:hypothetical protein
MISDYLFSLGKSFSSNGLHRTRSVATTSGTEGRTDEHFRHSVLSPFDLTDLQFKCTDGNIVRAHKLVLASRCPCVSPRPVHPQHTEADMCDPLAHRFVCKLITAWL